MLVCGLDVGSSYDFDICVGSGKSKEAELRFRR